MRRGAVLVFSLLVMMVAGIIIGSVGTYYAGAARLAGLYRDTTTERFTAQHVVETVVADLAGLVVDPISTAGRQLEDKATNFTQLKNLLMRDDSAFQAAAGGVATTRSATFQRGEYSVETSFDVSQLDVAVDVGDENPDDHRLLAVEAVVYAGGIAVARVRQVLQIDLLRIGVAKQTTRPVFDYVYFANNFGRLASSGIICNGNVGSNDRLTINGSVVNGYVWAHAESEGAAKSSVITLIDAKIWPYVTYMKRVTNAYKVDGHNFFTQVRPTDPNHAVEEGVTKKLDWTGGFAYPAGSDDMGTINDDGVYVPNAYPDMSNEPKMIDYTGTLICPKRYADEHEYPRFDDEEPKLADKPIFDGGICPVVTPATCPANLTDADKARIVLPYESEPVKPNKMVDDPGPNPLDAFWAAQPDMASYYYTYKSGQKKEWDSPFSYHWVDVYTTAFRWNEFCSANATWRATAVGQSWKKDANLNKAWSIPNEKDKDYYSWWTVKADNFKDDNYKSDLNAWVASAKAHPEYNKEYVEWKTKYDEYDGFLPIYVNYTNKIDKYIAYTNSLAVWAATNAAVSAAQTQYRQTTQALANWISKSNTWQTAYSAWLVSSNSWAVSHAAWLNDKAIAEGKQDEWKNADKASQQEISNWLNNSNSWQTSWNKWNGKYQEWRTAVDEIATSVNNGYYEVPLTTDLKTQNEYWDDVEQTSKSQKDIVTVSTNYVEMPNVSLNDGDFYRKYCATNEVIMTNAFGVFIKEKGGRLVCRNRYENITASGTTDEPITWSYTYNQKRRGICDLSLIQSNVGKEVTVEYVEGGTLSRTLSEVNVIGTGGDIYPFKDGAQYAPNAEKGSVVLIGTAKYPITINGSVYFDGDVLIRGFVSGQGAIYAGRNIHILGDITYLNPPSWPHANTADAGNDPRLVAGNNRNRDLLMLMARGCVVVGDYTTSEWATSFTNWMNRVSIEGGTSQKIICNKIDDGTIGYPTDLTSFGRSYGELESKYASRSWTGGYKAAVTWGSTPSRTDVDKTPLKNDPNFWSGLYHVKWEYYTLSPHETRGTLRHYETRLGDLVLTGLMQSKSTDSASGWSSSIIQRLIWWFVGYDTTAVNTGDMDIDYSQTSEAITSNAEAGDITHIDASLFANHGIFGMVGGSVSKKFTLNGGLVCRDEGLLSTMHARMPDAQAWLNYDLRLKSDSAEGNSVVAPTFSTQSAARTELRVSVRSWQQE